MKRPLVTKKFLNKLKVNLDNRLKLFQTCDTKNDLSSGIKTDGTLKSEQKRTMDILPLVVELDYNYLNNKNKRK